MKDTITVAYYMENIDAYSIYCRVWAMHSTLFSNRKNGRESANGHSCMGRQESARKSRQESVGIY